MVGWIKMPLGKKVGPGPGHIVLDGDPVGSQRLPQQPLPTFRPMSIVAKWSPISATAELLLSSIRPCNCGIFVLFFCKPLAAYCKQWLLGWLNCWDWSQLVQ